VDCRVKPGNDGRKNERDKEEQGKRNADRRVFLPSASKSIDLNAPTYQDFGRLTSLLDRYLVKLEDYRGTNWGGDRIDPDEITGRMLHLIIPKGSLKAVQRDAIEAARARAAAKGITIELTEF
jgi:hypothetical protein